MDNQTRAYLRTAEGCPAVAEPAAGAISNALLGCSTKMSSAETDWIQREKHARNEGNKNKSTDKPGPTQRITTISSDIPRLRLPTAASPRGFTASASIEQDVTKHAHQRIITKHTSDARMAYLFQEQLPQQLQYWSSTPHATSVGHQDCSVISKFRRPYFAPSGCVNKNRQTPQEKKIKVLAFITYLSPRRRASFSISQ